MALSLIQEYNPTTGPGESTSYASGSAGQVLGSPCGVGTAVVVQILTQTYTGTVSSVTSPMGTFTKVNALGGSSSVGTADVEWWVCLKTTASSDVITVTTSAGTIWWATAFEFYGGAASASSGGSVGPSTEGSPVSITVTCSAGDVVLVGEGSGDTALLTDTAQPASPWNVFPAAPEPGGDSLPNTVWQLAAAGPSVTATWSNALGDVDSTSLLAIILTPDLPTPPTPTLVSPANASIFDVSSGVSFEATYNASGSDAMNAYAMRVKLSGGSYNYWNAGTNALQSSIVWNADSVLANQNFTVSLPSGALSDGNIYNWSMATQDAVSGGQGPFAVDYTFTAQVAPSVSVTAPTGTVSTTTQPTVRWTSTTAPGTVQVTYSIIVESGTYGTTPGSGTQAWASGSTTSGLNSAQIGTPLDPASVSYRAFVQISQTGGQTSTWGYTTFTVTVDTPATPTITAAVSTSSDTGCPVIAIEVQALDNYLSKVDSSFETGIGTAVGTNCTPTSSTAESLDGTHSLLLTPTAAGTMSVKLGPYAASVGQEFKAFAAFRAGVDARTCTVGLSWQGGSGSSTSSGTADSTSAWTQSTSRSAPAAGLVVTGTAPSGTTGVYVTLTVESTSGTSDVHYADCTFVGPSGATLWGLGGFVGLTTVVVTRSDNQYVRWASTTNPLPVPSAGQLAEVYDYEAVPGVEYTYTAYVQQASVPLASATATSGDVTQVTTAGWWELNPLAGTATSNPSAINAQMTAWAPVQTEQSTANQVIGQPHMNIVANAMMNQDFTGTAELFSDAVYQAFNALLTSQATLFVSSPWGLIDSGFFRVGPESGGMSSGMGTTAKNTTLMPSVYGAGHRTVAVTAVAQARPSV